MNSTGKILFGSFLAISVTLMFLIFSMQKSAQLKLDMTDIQHAITTKDNTIKSIRGKLASAQATAQHAEIKNKLIPTLQNNLKTIEQEKLVYIQQLDDFQAELQNQTDIAEKRLAEIKDLQKQQQEQQQLLDKSMTEIATADQHKSELTATLQATQQEITTRELESERYVETLAQKDRVIQIYKEKLDKIADDMTFMQVNDSNDRLNLKLILDELAIKTATVEQLTNQLNWANSPETQSRKLLTQEPSPTTDNETDQALIIKLSLENDNLGLEIQEQKKLLKELQSKCTSNDELISSYATELEQLRLTNSAKDNDSRVLQDRINTIELNTAQLKNDLDNKEKELQKAKTQTQAIAEPLTKKITALERQLSQGATLYTQIAKSLSQAQTSLATLQNEKKILTDELNSLKTANKNAEAQLATLSGVLESKEVALLQKEDTRQSLAGKIDPLKQALTESEERYASLTNNFTDLKEQLVCAVESREELSSNFEFLQSEVAEQDVIIQKLEKRLADESAQIVELKGDVIKADLDSAKMAKAGEKNKERISKLIEEVAAAKANTAGLEARNKELLAALSQKQESGEPAEAQDSESTDMANEGPVELKAITEEIPETLNEVMEKVQEEASEENM